MNYYEEMESSANYRQLVKAIEKRDDEYLLLIGEHYSLRKNSAITALNSLFNRVHIIDFTKEFALNTTDLSLNRLDSFLSKLEPNYKKDKDIAFLLLNYSNAVPLREVLNELAPLSASLLVVAVDYFLPRRKLQYERTVLFYPPAYSEEFEKLDPKELDQLKTSFKNLSAIDIDLHNKLLAFFMNYLLNLTNPKAVKSSLLRRTKADDSSTKWLQKKLLELHQTKVDKLIYSFKKSIKETRDCHHIMRFGCRKDIYRAELDLMMYNGILTEIPYYKDSKDIHANNLYYPTNPSFYLSSLDYFDYLRFLSGDEDLTFTTIVIVLVNMILSYGYKLSYFKSSKNARPIYIIDEPHIKAVFIVDRNDFYHTTAYLNRLLDSSYKIFVLSFDRLKERDGILFVPLYMLPLLLD